MIEDLSDAEIVGRLQEVRREGHKCVWSFHWFTCPKCEQKIRLEHAQMHGRQLILCPCGINERFDFARVLDRWPGPLNPVTDEIL